MSSWDMNHPGPPRFVGVGESVELAPRDPNPEETYTWEIVQKPDDSAETLGDDPVEHLVPDVPGTYTVVLSAPDGEHRLTVRVFPGNRVPGSAGVEGRSGRSGFSGRSGRSGFSGQSGISGGRSGYSAGESDRAPETVPEGEGGRPRLALYPVIEGDEAVVKADPRAHPGGAETDEDLDVEFLLDDRDDIDYDDVTIDDRELRIPVEALPDRARIHAVAIGEYGYSVPDMAEFTREADGIDTHRPYVPPEWAGDSFIYEIYVRSFAGDDSSPFDAIIDRLDYLDSLGVDVLWLTPVLENDHAPHGYNITDFFSIAEDLGTRKDYEELVETAHDHGIKVLFDVVLNHSARTHPFFKNASEGPGSEYRDWYEWQSETEPGTYFEWEHIANFNFGNLEVRRHLLDAVDQWVDIVDGFRCDMAWAVPDNFWRELHDRCKAEDRDFLLLDETIPYIPEFQAGLFDMHFDSTTYFTLRQIGHGQDADTVLNAIDDRTETGFPDHAGFMLYSENHDEARYIPECGRPEAEAAMGAVFTLPGAPMIYAGQEFGQQGRRDNLAWEHAHEDLQEYVADLATTRHEQPALTADAETMRVDYDVRAGHADRVTAYGRATDDDAAVVVLHFGEGEATVSVPAAGETDAVSGESVGSGEEITVDNVVVLPASPDEL